MKESWLRKFGRLQYRVRRVISYFQMVNFCMVGYLFFDRIGWEKLFWMGPLGIIAIAFVHLFDKNHSLPAENEVNLRDNPEWQRFKQKIDDLERIIRHIDNER